MTERDVEGRWFKRRGSSTVLYMVCAPGSSTGSVTPIPGEGSGQADPDAPCSIGTHSYVFGFYLIKREHLRTNRLLFGCTVDIRIAFV